MILRDQLMDEAYFDDSIEFDNNNIPEYEKEYLDDPDSYKPFSVYSTLFTYKYEQLISKYSRGYEINVLKEDFMEVLRLWEKIFTFKGWEDSAFYFENDQDDYEVSLWLLSFAYFFKLEKKDVDRVIKSIGVHNQGKDGLFDILIGVAKNANKSTPLLYPDIYKQLYESFFVPQTQKISLISAFLGNWYSNTDECYWNENHKGVEGGGYFGYWCWEAALAVYLLDLDDSQIRDMPYYPKDMVDFARGKV